MEGVTCGLTILLVLEEGVACGVTMLMLTVHLVRWFQRHCWYLVLCENTNFNFYTFSENEDIQNVKVYEVPNQGSGAGDRTIKITSKQNLSD